MGAYLLPANKILMEQSSSSWSCTIELPYDTTTMKGNFILSGEYLNALIVYKRLDNIYI